MNEFITFLDNLFGTYSPVLNPDGTIAAGFAGLDFPYIFRAIIFCIVVYSLFRVIGGLICKNY